MTLLIDPPSWPGHGRLWSHLVSDVSFAELHAFAAALGIPERVFEGDHYDVPEEHYQRMVAAGAAPVATRHRGAPAGLGGRRRASAGGAGVAGAGGRGRYR